MQRLQPYRVESLDGAAEGLITGYFEPLIEASRSARAAPSRCRCTRRPPTWRTRKPYWTRQQLDTLPAAQAALRGREIAYVADPLDALVLQIQGSGRLRLAGADGRAQTVRLAYRRPQRPALRVGGPLADRPGRAQAPTAPTGRPSRTGRGATRSACRRCCGATRAYVFFREEPLPDPSVGPRGAQGVPLTPGRSIAVDPQSVPYGTPVWLDTTEPLSKTPLQRLVLAQDTGSAITGAVRADYFWGWGDGAEAQAGRMKQPLRMWVLWPKTATN